jgi:hypothetical protein
MRVVSGSVIGTVAFDSGTDAGRAVGEETWTQK